MVLLFGSGCEKFSIDQEAHCGNVFYRYYLLFKAHSAPNQNLIHEALNKCFGVKLNLNPLR